jgi:hypothetical protein
MVEGLEDLGYKTCLLILVELAAHNFVLDDHLQRHFPS